MSSIHSIGSMNQLADALDIAGYTPDDVTRLRQSNLKGFKEVLYGKAKIIPAEKDALLNFVGTVTIPATTVNFVALDKFVINTEREAPVKIYCSGDNFKKRFLNKTEEHIRETILRYYDLNEKSRDIPIINELGGEDVAETTLTPLFTLIERQGNGENGVLLTNGYANIFYVRDDEGVLWAVGADWHAYGWYVDASSIGNPNDWDAGNRVFSCNSRSQVPQIK